MQQRLGFIVTRCDTTEFLDLGEVIFDQVPPAIDFIIIFPLHNSVRFWRDHGSCTAFAQLFKQPIGVKRLVSQQRSERNASDQRSHPLHIVGLPRQQQELYKITKRVHQCHDFGGQPAARAPNGLILSPPFAPVAF